MAVPFNEDGFVIKRHARRPYLRLQVTSVDSEGNESEFDFTGAVGATFLMYDAGNVQKVSAAGTIESPETSGVLRYAWQAGDTDTAGEFRAEFDVDYGGGETLTVPVNGHLMVRIYEDLNDG